MSGEKVVFTHTLNSAGLVLFARTLRLAPVDVLLFEYNIASLTGEMGVGTLGWRNKGISFRPIYPDSNDYQGIMQLQHDMSSYGSQFIYSRSDSSNEWSAEQVYDRVSRLFKIRKHPYIDGEVHYSLDNFNRDFHAILNAIQMGSLPEGQPLISDQKKLSQVTADIKWIIADIQQAAEKFCTELTPEVLKGNRDILSSDEWYHLTNSCSGLAIRLFLTRVKDFKESFSDKDLYRCKEELVEHVKMVERKLLLMLDLLEGKLGKKFSDAELRAASENLFPLALVLNKEHESLLTHKLGDSEYRCYESLELGVRIKKILIYPQHLKQMQAFLEKCGLTEKVQLVDMTTMLPFPEARPTLGQFSLHSTPGSIPKAFFHQVCVFSKEEPVECFHWLQTLIGKTYNMLSNDEELQKLYGSPSHMSQKQSVMSATREMLARFQNHNSNPNNLRIEELIFPGGVNDIKALMCAIICLYSIGVGIQDKQKCESFLSKYLRLWGFNATEIKLAEELIGNASYMDAAFYGKKHNFKHVMQTMQKSSECSGVRLDTFIYLQCLLQVCADAAVGMRREKYRYFTSSDSMFDYRPLSRLFNDMMEYAQGLRADYARRDAILSNHTLSML